MHEGVQEKGNEGWKEVQGQAYNEKILLGLQMQAAAWLSGTSSGRYDSQSYLPQALVLRSA